MSKTQESLSIPSASRIRGRLHSPSLGETFLMTWTGVRGRIGRTIVTWLGIVLGIAFLMSTLLVSHIRSSLSVLTERRTAVQSMFGIVRAEIGTPAGKKLVIVAEEPIEEQRLLDDLVAYLNNERWELELVGPMSFEAISGNDGSALANASGIIVWSSGQEGLANDTWNRHLAAMKQPVVLVFGDTAAFDAVAEQGARVRSLQPAPDERQQMRQQTEKHQRETRTRWLIVVSFLVATIGISNSMLMNVTERYREIGTMKCLGALNGFIIRLILIESGLLGGFGALAGAIVGVAFAVGGYSSTYGLGVVIDSIDTTVLITSALLCLVLGGVVALLAGIYPAWVAARMVPADALRTEI